MIPFDKLATIRSETLSRVDGSEVMTKSDYITTPCDFWTKSQNKGRQTDVVRESVDDSYEVIIPITLKGSVSRGMVVNLQSIDGISVGTYLIDSIDIFELGNPETDNILLKVSKTSNG